MKDGKTLSHEGHRVRMLSNRSYRKAMNESICREQVAANAGVMYDPALVPSVLENWDGIITARQIEFVSSDWTRSALC